jgi:uncharacterized Zn-finger protein
VNNWRDATDDAVSSEEVVCPGCGAMNAPGRTYVEVSPHGVCWCSVCTKVFTVNLKRSRDR